MTYHTINQAIHAQIETTFPESQAPLAHHWLMARYQWNPDPTPELEEAQLLALRSIAAVTSQNPSLPEGENEQIGLSQFLQEFAQQIQAEAAAQNLQ